MGLGIEITKPNVYFPILLVMLNQFSVLLYWSARKKMLICLEKTRYYSKSLHSIGQREVKAGVIQQVLFLKLGPNNLRFCGFFLPEGTAPA